MQFRPHSFLISPAYLPIIFTFCRAFNALTLFVWNMSITHDYIKVEGFLSLPQIIRNISVFRRGDHKHILNPDEQPGIMRL